MEAKELRVGNKVLLGVLEWDITLNDFVEEYETGQTFFHFKPIPITKEWLLKFGFEETDNIYKLKNFGKFIFFEHLNSFGFYPSGLLNSLMRMDNLKSVHQLQNLYFALTNQELTI